jgi:hypothetical protein
MAGKIARAGIFVSALAVCAAGSSAGAAGRVTCSIRGLDVAPVHVVALHVQGMSCTSARTVAGKVATDLAHGRSVSVPGSVGFGMSQQSCTGCKTTTSVTITYPHGSLAISLRGGSGANSTAPAPSFGSSGGGTVI